MFFYPAIIIIIGLVFLRWENKTSSMGAWEVFHFLCVILFLPWPRYHTGVNKFQVFCKPNREPSPVMFQPI